jgi:enamine deaminase RidA (YjgF/YER057c/UK114 family)
MDAKVRSDFPVTRELTYLDTGLRLNIGGFEMSAEERLRELGYTLPEPPMAKGMYVTAVEVDSMLYTAGSSCFEDGRVKYQGKLGSDVTVEQGRDAARCTMLNLLSILKQKVGDLDRVEQVVKVLGFVASAPGFNNQPEVLNGASELLEEVFGEQGRHARSAVGVNELPMNVSVEIEMIVKLKDS